MFMNAGIASEITECTNFEAPVTYDASHFKYSKTRKSDGSYRYHYLMDSVFFSKEGNVELRARISIFLKASGKAVVRYSEGLWKRVSDTQRSLIETTFENEFETTWSTSGFNLVVHGVGSGQSATCFEEGYEVYFTYESNLGPSSLKGKKLILHYGLSTYDPFKN
jgi:hypothetical protein